MLRLCSATVRGLRRSGTNHGSPWSTNHGIGLGVRDQVGGAEPRGQAPRSSRVRRDVVGHLLDQRLDAVEGDHAAEPLDELDLDLDAVELEVGAVEHVGLDAALAHALEGRVGADADRGGGQDRSGRCVERGAASRRTPRRRGRADPVRWARWRSGSRARGRAGRRATTCPATVNGRPSASAAPATSPAARQVRT